MNIRTLKHTEFDALLDTFNRAFSDYLVPLQLTGPQLQDKLIVDRIDLSLSMGAFAEDRLVGFVLHGCDKVDGRKTAYNAGTGVIPEKRGQQLTRKMYDFIRPALERKKIEQCLLEVIVGNKAALPTYKAIGFSTTRTLDCYKGEVSPGPAVPDIKELSDPDWQQLESFWDWKPTWQNSVAAFGLSAGKYRVIGSMNGEKLAGYTIYQPETGRILQFAVHQAHRRQGHATRMFRYIGEQTGKPLSMINIDHGSKATEGFLQSVGVNRFLQQYEMEWNVTSLADMHH